MQRFLFIMQFILLAIATPAWSASNTSSCEAQARSIKGSAHDKFLVSCLAQESSPEHVRAVAEQNKRKLCEQNAKNQHLAGSQQAAYLNSCMNQNQALAEANRQNSRTPTLAKAEPPKHSHKVATTKLADAPQKNVAQHKSAKKPTGSSTCAQRAAQRKLTGDKRKKFMRDCYKA